MTLNYLLMALCGGYGLFGLIAWRRGGSKVRPFTVMAALLVFVLAAVATAMGVSYDQLRLMIEGR